MATVLLSTIAATIAMVVVHQTVLAARAQSVRSDFDAANRAALDTKLAFERALAEDPMFFTKRLFFAERPRMCPRTGPFQAVIATGDSSDDATWAPWPADCPATWTYLPAGQKALGDDGASYDPATRTVRAEIIAPSATSSALTLRVLADVGTAETGLTATYRTSSSSAVTVYSQTDLRLDTVYASAATGDDADVTVRGTLYSGGVTFLPSTGADFTGAQLFAECGFVGLLPEGGRFYAGKAGGVTAAGCPGGAPMPGSTGDIRTVARSPLALEQLRAGYPALTVAGCPAGATPANLAGEVRLSTLLCLRSGRSLVDTADANHTVAATNSAGAQVAPAAYLLLFGGTHAAPTVRVFTAATAPSKVGACTIRCDLRSLAAADFAAGLHPASPPGAGVWQPLGEFASPATGVIVTDADTFIGQCPTAITGTAACPATTAHAPVTVVAGSPRAPRDIILAGPLAAGTDVHVGLIATRSVVVPYYARPAGGDLTVEANVLSFGYGLPAGTSGLRAFPATQAPLEVAPGNYGGTFTIRGSIASPTLTAALAGWRRVAVTPGASNGPDSAPPYFPGFAAGWQPQQVDRLSSFDVCTADSCATSW